MEIRSLQDFKNNFSNIEQDQPTPLKLAQSYKEWLAEHPNGYQESELIEQEAAMFSEFAVSASNYAVQ
jgi:hypothetical protein